jgi:phage replication O-like protein O
MRIKEVKGWGQLPREMARALAKAKVNGSESRVLWAMVYKTIAFNKASDRIPWCQLEELTGIDQWHLGRAINSLLKKGLILKKDKEYGFHIDFDKEELPPKRVVKDKLPPDQGELPPNQGELPPKRVDSRDLSKRAIQEKGLSASKDKKRGKKQLEIIRKARMEFERILKEKKKQ